MTTEPRDVLDEIVERACARIAPTWPLDRFIAVNPFWGLTDAPLPEVAARLRATSGAQLLMPRAFYRDAYREGTLRDEHLRAALDQTGASESLASLRALLERDEPAVPTRLRVIDLADAGRDLRSEPSWRSFVVSSVSRQCAAYFDEDQAALGPDRQGGLYASWLRHAQHDRSPALVMGASSHRALARALPGQARTLIAEALAGLQVEPAQREDYLWALLLDQNGWASWCAYRRWTARLEGRDDAAIVDLLAIRLAWEWLLYRAGGPALERRWASARASWEASDAAAAHARASDWLLQAALEIAWREPVLRALPRGFDAARPTEVAVQAVFCIDVRSEVFRRALEASSPSVQTLGFAGFFGLPIEYQPLGAHAARPQLPGLLAPRLRVEDTGLGADDAARRARQLGLASAWRSFRTDALSSFTFVEALGVTYAAQLLAAGLGMGRAPDVERAGLRPASDQQRRPRLTGTIDGEPLDVATRAELAMAMLRGMSLTRGWARLVLLAGHGSTTRNNPHAAGLDCGACCGQTGEVNARVAAALLNDPEVRAALAERGVAIPAHTHFIAGLHDTTSDDVELFETEELPASHGPDLDALRSWLAQAGVKARRERAARLGLDAADATQVEKAIRARTRDWAAVRPEWGLAGNAAFIVAPRERCRHLDLQGRAFLHEYRHDEDDGHATLELIMTAPMVVTHWINLQYYASTVDNLRYGSGDKVLHDVVGEHLGVFEGNGGDLRIGLPLQSLHDGARWVHTPLRLSVFIEAPREAIEQVLSKHPKVRELVDHEWLWLFQLDERARAVHALRGGAWQKVSAAEPGRGQAA